MKKPSQKSAVNQNTDQEANDENRHIDVNVENDLQNNEKI